MVDFIFQKFDIFCHQRVQIIAPILNLSSLVILENGNQLVFTEFRAGAGAVGIVSHLDGDAEVVAQLCDFVGIILRLVAHGIIMIVML